MGCDAGEYSMVSMAEAKETHTALFLTSPLRPQAGWYLVTQIEGNVRRTFDIVDKDHSGTIGAGTHCWIYLSIHPITFHPSSYPQSTQLIAEIFSFTSRQ